MTNLSEAKHTPGPWMVLDDEDGHEYGYSVGPFVTNRWGGVLVDPIVESIKLLEDARLIAAAPTLLEALDSLLSCRWVADTVSAEVDAARAAIAQARGA